MSAGVACEFFPSSMNCKEVLNRVENTSKLTDPFPSQTCGDFQVIAWNNICLHNKFSGKHSCFLFLGQIQEQGSDESLPTRIFFQGRDRFAPVSQN